MSKKPVIKRSIVDIYNKDHFNLKGDQTPAEHLNRLNEEQRQQRLSNPAAVAAAPRASSPSPNPTPVQPLVQPSGPQTRAQTEKQKNNEAAEALLRLYKNPPKGGSAPHSVSFIKNNKKHTRRVYIVKNKKYIKFENKDIPISKLKLTN